ncbi:Predicted Zn-dependent peptidase [Oceanobacillus limi]|uniref:Predicted Zn-dependent peptidase n=1 Tax=Oceanobacillus limi TaxID=930131 RepID=A0A1H9Z7Q6_9BACI|nr:pitrilysin family protein [Oceanobacillus limi]SES76896.1 Predicted Zn-dependent peptidase [Oceanobacillus limi]
MNEIQEEVLNVNGYNLHLIPNKKFKTINLVAKFKAPLQKSTITKRALLPYVLKQGPKSYPSRKDLQTKLDSLYGAVLSIDSGKKGENHIISMRLEVANQKFIPNETGILEEAVQLLNDVIFNPNSNAGSFNPEIFNREKNTLKQKINSIKDDKMNFANMRLIDEMCEGEPYQLHVHGYEEDLTDLTAQNTFGYYQSLLQEDELDLFVLGDFDSQEMKNLISNTIERSSTGKAARDKNATSGQGQSNKQKPNEVIEKQNIQQAKLHIGYRTNCTYSDDGYPALQVFNGILGAFPSSKLFINVREKNSLAYYASSRLESHKGLLLVFSGIAPEDYEKAREIIELQMSAMKNGDVSESELKETKDLIVNQLLETLDHPQGIIEMLYQQVIAETSLKPSQLIEKIKKVTLDEVVQIASKVEEDTVYLLTTSGGEPGE